MDSQPTPPLTGKRMIGHALGSLAQLVALGIAALALVILGLLGHDTGDGK